MLAIIRDHKVLEVIKPQLLEAIEKCKQKIGTKKSPEEVYRYILTNIYKDDFLFYVKMDGPVLEGYLIAQANVDFWGNKGAYISQAYNTKGNARSNFKEIEKSLFNLGVRSITFLTKRNDKAFNKLLNGLEYEGKIFTKSLVEDK